MGGRTDKVVYRVADSRLKTITITTLQYPSHQPQHSNYDKKKKQPYCTQLINWTATRIIMTNQQQQK